MFAWTKLLVSAFVACLAVACSGVSEGNGGARGLDAALSFDPAPHIGIVECTVALTDANGAPAKCTEVELEGNMNHAGMVPVFARAEPRGDGSFVAPLEFTMGGDWLIFVRGRSEAGLAFEIVKEVSGVRPLPASETPARDANR